MIWKSHGDDHCGRYVKQNHTHVQVKITYLIVFSGRQ